MKVSVRGGDSFDAALLGKGGVGVVFGHQLHDNFCSWLPFAQKVASRGMVALAVNFPSTRHLDAYLLAAVDELRRDGVTKIILVGASMGGTGALVAAAEEKDVAGVASVSGPELFSDLNALPAVRKIKIPLLFLVARQDASFAADARRLYRAASSRAKRLLVTSGSEHGTGLISADPSAERALLRFIEQVAA